MRPARVMLKAGPGTQVTLRVLRGVGVGGRGNGVGR